MPDNMIIFLAVFMGVLVVWALFNLVNVLLLYRKTIISKLWIETVGTITSACVDCRRVKSEKEYWASFTYSYLVNGHDYVGKSKIEDFFNSQMIAEKNVAEHPVGSTLMVRYNPEKTEEFISEYDQTVKFRVIRWLILLVIVMAFVVAYLVR